MRRNLTLSIISILTIAISCFGQNDNTFSISGKTKDLPDGTILLLQNPLLNKFIDSVKVVQNTFSINTNLTDFPVKLTLWKDGSTAKTIWVEDKKMTFDSSNSSFEDAIIIGSITDSIASSIKRKYKELSSYEEIVSFELNFIKNNPNNILSAHNLSIMAKVFGQKTSQQLFNNLSDKNKQSSYGKMVSEYLALNITETPQIGEKYVDFSMSNQNGEQKRLSELDNKYILLEFWASWCVPCRKENPDLVKIYNKYKESEFEIFAVSLDENRDSWTQAIAKDKLDWIHVSDLKGLKNQASLIYSVNSIPDNVLIDKNGVIIARNLRSNKLDQMLSELILKKTYAITKEKGITTLRLSESIVWKDEKGKVLTESEIKEMVNSNKYIPHLNSEKNIIILVKRN